MAGRDDPRDSDSAPGVMPGAEAFVRGGQGVASSRAGAAEPQGIVRLSDLVSRASAAPSGANDPPGAEPAAARRRQRPHGARPAAGAEVPERFDPSDGGGTTPDGAAPAIAGAGDTADPLGGAVVAPAYEPLFGSGGNARGRRERPKKPPATATQRALGLLTRREHSRKELTRKLVTRGVDPAEVEAAVDKLASAGWQDERRFADALVRARASAGYGPLHIRAELSTHDLPAELRQEALESFEGDWNEIAADLVRRRFGRLVDPRVRERKAADFLLRRGFPSDLARRVSRFEPERD